MPVLVKFNGKLQNYYIYDLPINEVQSMVDRLVTLHGPPECTYGNINLFPIFSTDFTVTQVTKREAATLRQYLGNTFGIGLADVENLLYGYKKPVQKVPYDDTEVEEGGIEYCPVCGGEYTE